MEFANGNGNGDGPLRWFIGDRFAPAKLGRALLDELGLVCAPYTDSDRDTLWVHLDGWQEDEFIEAEDIVRRRVADEMGDEWQPEMGEQVLEWLRLRFVQQPENCVYGMAVAD